MTFVLTFFWLTALVLVIPNLCGFILWAFRKKSSNFYNANQKLTICYVSRGDNQDVLHKSLSETKKIDPDVRIEVVTDIEIQNKTEGVDYYLVPSDFGTEKGSKFKARALEYLRQNRPDTDWILHLDEESVVTTEAMAGIRKFITKNDHYTIGQGLILYRKSGNFLIRCIDSIRTGDDLGRFHFQYSAIKRPVFGMHGSYVLVSQELEDQVTFDLGPKGSITEDAYFATLAWQNFNAKVSWVEGHIVEQSPFRVQDIIRQRARWYRGLANLCLDEINLKNKIVLCISVLAWTLALFSPVAIVFDFFWPAPMPFWYYVLLMFVWLSFLLVYAVGAFKNFKSAWMVLAAVLLAPISALVEACGVVFGLWQLIRKNNSFFVVKK